MEKNTKAATGDKIVLEYTRQRSVSSFLSDGKLWFTQNSVVDQKQSEWLRERKLRHSELLDYT